MATKNNFISINNISNKSSRCKAIEVRVLRIWKKNHYRQEYKEMILIDAEGSKIQATIPTSVMSKHGDSFKEGKIFRLENFAVGDNDPQNQKGKVKHSCIIKISLGTKVMDVDNGVVISENGFNFVPFSNFLNNPKSGLPNNVENEMVIDVIGELLLPLGEIEVVAKAYNKRKMDVRLIDHDGVELVAALWENYADELTAYVNAREEVADESIVLILQFVILSSYNCIHRVTTMVGATKMHINPTFPEHAEFRKKLIDGSSMSSRTITAATNDSFNTNFDDYLKTGEYKTISELLECSDVGDYTVHAKIADVDTDKTWYYDACNSGNCRKKIESIGKICKGCNKEVKSSVPRFMLKIIVRSIDDNDESSATFTLFDRDAVPLLNITAAQAKDQVEKDGKSGGFPDAVETLFEKNCLFRVKVDKFLAGHSNVVSNDSKNFTVQSLICDPELISHIISQINKDDVEVASKLNVDRNNAQDVRDEAVKDVDLIKEHSHSSSSQAITPEKRPIDVLDVDEDFQLSTTSIKTTKKIKTEKSD